MAWDTEGTRRRLKEAATREFAEYGPDGTTMARIAGRAGLNKERLYNYFGDKRTLFESVLADELGKLAAAVVVDDFAVRDVGEMAGRTFDYHADHPDLIRLLQWEGLGGPTADEVNRTDHYRTKVEAIVAAQHDGDVAADLDPAYLTFVFMALGAWWFAVPQLARMLTGADPNDPRERARRRAFVVTSARLLAAPADDRRPPSA